MGHHSAKDVYRQLSDKLDGSTARMPDHTILRDLLSELYTPEEAALVALMPWRLSNLNRIARLTNEEPRRLSLRLDALADKGLVLDLLKASTQESYYAPSPFVVGVFEFTMMRAGPKASHAHRAHLFHEYLEQGDFYRANLGNGQAVFIARTLPHHDSFADATEILDAHRVEAIVEQATQFAVGICSCRHEREHTTGRACSTPLETCTAMGIAADYLVRHQLARPIERSEMREIVARSRESGLVMCADNVKRDVGFICHCCRCCCHLVRGITEFGYPNTIATAPFMPACDSSKCAGCQRCIQACPVEALSSEGAERTRASGKRPVPVLEASRCIGCGVCVTRCNRDALKLVPGTRRYILPENSFERVLLQSLERGTLQNLIFDEVANRTHGALRALL
ncbi:MAG TPA: 4Fe-4S binding protein, partial [Polyangiaceae bacterium]|nr:4Fe-4S binding protein [Polyangiaceae bacterium]